MQPSSAAGKEVCVVYRLHEPFTTFGEDRQPITMDVERSSNYPHLHSRVVSDGYALSCLGNRHFFITPQLSDFSLELLWYCTLTTVKPADVGILFRYDRINRTGIEIGFAFDLKGNLSIGLFYIKGLDRLPLGDSVLLPDIHCDDGVKYQVSICLCGDKINGTIADHDFSITGVPVLPAGQIGFQRRNFVGEWVLCDAKLSSTDTIEEKTILTQQEVVLPHTDGGTIPYELYYSVIRRGGQKYLDYTFLGGPQYRHKYYPPITKSLQYSGEINTFYDPYVKLYFTDTKPITAMLVNGKLVVTDPALQWKSALDQFFGTTLLPLTGSIPLPESKHLQAVALGYKFFTASGHQLQEYGPREYLYDLNGNYLGADLYLESYRLLSPTDKKAVQIIPKDCYDYPCVRKHYEENHYFSESENVDLTLEINNVNYMEYLQVEAELQNAYAEALELLPVAVSKNQFNVVHAPLPVGVYRIEFRIYLGERVLKTVNHAFEVFDITGKRCAPIESGLPFIYSTPNEQRYLERDSYDPWNPMPSCDVEHYFPCCCMTGVYGEKKRIWDILPLFGRKWYVWLTTRTMNDYAIENHKDIVRHADYLITEHYIRRFNMRSDYWKADVYNGPLLNLLDRFLTENPQYAARIDYRPGGESISREELKQLLQTSGDAWYDYANADILEAIRKSNAQIKALNPNSLRANYGPYPIYGTCYTSYYCIKRFGLPIDDRLSDEIFTGFAQFEDYPASCAYHTYRATWAVMTIRLHIPRLRIYPEQYRSSIGGCIDGAVKFASPPMGDAIIPEYYQMTHSREFVWNTPGFTKDGFVYWDDYGFMKRSFNWHEIDYYARSWKSINRHRPAKPYRGAAFITDYCADDDRLTEDIYPEVPWLTAFNISEENHGYFYERLRETGIPGGFALKWDALEALTPEDTDCLVLPNLANAPAEALKKIRSLHASGVSLLAVSDVTGLEDLFGVKEDRKIHRVCALRFNGDTENVFPYNCEFRYRTAGAQVLLDTDDGTPVLLCHERTALFNTSVSSAGRDTFANRVQYTRENISNLLRRASASLWKELTDPVITADSAGLTHFIDVHGNEMLFVVDYTPYDQKDPYLCQNACMICFREPCKDVLSAAEVDVNCIRNADGFVIAAEVILRARESALLQVIR